MQIRKVKLEFNIKPRNESIRNYMQGELCQFERLCDDDHASHFEPNEEGVSFQDRYISFLNSSMKKGDIVDVQVLEEFISDLDNVWGYDDLVENWWEEMAFDFFQDRVKKLKTLLEKNKKLVDTK